jgi:hypothetical protein
LIQRRPRRFLAAPWRLNIPALHWRKPPDFNGAMSASAKLPLTGLWMARGARRFLLVLCGWLAAANYPCTARIDRHALVARHNPELRAFDPWNPLSVGNGDFAFTADATGLQTFPDSFTLPKNIKL